MDHQDGSTVNATGGSPRHRADYHEQRHSLQHRRRSSGTFPGNNNFLESWMAPFPHQCPVAVERRLFGLLKSGPMPTMTINVWTNVSSAGDRKQFRQGFSGLVEIIGVANCAGRPPALTNGGDNTLFRVTGLMHARNDGIISLGCPLAPEHLTAPRQVERRSILSDSGGHQHHLLRHNRRHRVANANAIINRPGNADVLRPLFYSGNTTISNGVPPLLALRN